MASKRQKTPESRDMRGAIVDAALRQAAMRDWQNVTLKDIADEAGVTLADVARNFECREDIICAYGRRVDGDVIEGFTASGSERDMIFDILMGRLERLNQDRAAVLSILNAAQSDPKQLVVGMPHIARSVVWMLEACGIETQGLKGAARVAGVTGVYVWTLRRWREDESADMGATMATLDRVLGRAESLAGMLGL